MGLYLILFLLLFFFIILFFVLNKYNPTSLFTGSTLLLVFATICFISISLLTLYSERLAYWIILPIAIIFGLILIFWFIILLIAVLLNTRAVLKRERKSVANLLPLISFIGFIVMEIIIYLLHYFLGEYRIVKMLISCIQASITYFIVVFLMYTFTAFMYNILPTMKKIDYIVILGAGLNKDRVTPLLAARIDAGIAFYNKQFHRKKHRPTIILSGGQGADEEISEAQAMFNYIEETYGSEFPVYLENRSTSTLENLYFSEQLAIEKDGIESFKKTNIALATSAYHLLRAGKIARTLKIIAYGVGGKTKFYYIPTAFIREFIGYMALKKKFHIIVLLLIFIVSCISNLF